MPGEDERSPQPEPRAETRPPERPVEDLPPPEPQTQTPPEPPTPWLQNLLDRRVPQILGLYLGASWGIVQFVAWLTDRYGLAENLPEIALVTTLSLIPTVTLLAYFHGHPSKIVGSRWTRVEKIGIPANLVFTAILLLSVAGGDRAAATTEAVTVIDETGQEVERRLPKREYRKRVAIFNFDNAAGDPELDWLGDALTAALGMDLVQDLFFDIRMPLSSEGLRDKARDAGFPHLTGIPLTLQRKIARDLHLDYFVRGTFEHDGGVYAVSTALYDSESSKLLAERSAEGEDPFDVIDRLAVDLREDVGLPEDHLDRTEDLPVAELLTRSLPAAELFSRGCRAMLVDRDLETASALITRALEEDPTFAAAALILSQTCAERNDTACAKEAIEVAMEHLYKLPERLQYATKDAHYFYNEEHEKRLRLVEMRAELFPEDIDVHLNLVNIYGRRNAWDEALEHFQRALDLAAEPAIYYRDLASVYAKKGDVAQAREYYQRYVDRFPDEAGAYVSLGRFLEQLDDYESARANYEKALLLDPGNVSTLLDLGDVERNLGRLDLARAQYEKALERSRDPADRAEVYGRLERFHRIRGQMRRALEYFELEMAELTHVLPPRDLVLRRLFNVHRYVEAGQEETARTLVSKLAAELEPPFDRLAVVGYLRIYNETGDVAGAENALPELEQVYEDFGGEVDGLQPFLHFSRARTLEARGEHEAALTSYREGLAADRSNREFSFWIGRAQREAGRLRESRENLEVALRAFAFDPKVYSELSRTLLALGDAKKAREYAERAVELWKDADPDYPPAVEARALLAELAASS